MLLEEFDQLAASSGMRQANGRYYGVHNSFPFSVVVNRKAAGIVTFQFRLDATLENSAYKMLNKSLPKGYGLMAAAGNSYQLICTGSKLRHSECSVTQALNLFTSGLREAGINPSDLCPVCKQGGCDAYADVGGYTAVHSTCVEALSVSAANQAHNALRSGSYITGLIGALVGGLIACIPNIIAYMAGWMVGYFYALIPLGAYYGYKMFRGRMNRGAFVFTCIASLIHLFTMEQILFYINIYQELGLLVNVIDSVRLYWSMVSVEALVQDMYMSVIFMGLGLWISWGRIRRNAFTDLHLAGTVRDTLSQKPGVTPAYACVTTQEEETVPTASYASELEL